MRLSILLAAVALFLTGAEAPPPTAASEGVVIAGPKGEVVVDASDLKAGPRIRVSASVHGNDHKFEGVALATLLAKVSPPIDRLKAEALDQAVLVSARDGYRVAFGIAELDPTIRSQVIIVADTMDGAPIDAEDGPLRLIF